MNKTKSDKGITLIALIITVIVLLILAGVAINAVLGEDGLINKTSQSTEKYQESQAKEELTMILAGYYMEKIQDEKADIGTYLSQSGATLKEEQTENYIVEYKGYEITIKKDKLEIVEVQKADGITPRIEISEEKIIGKTTVKVKVLNYADFEDKSSITIKVTKADGTEVLNKAGEEEGNFEVTTIGNYNIAVTGTSADVPKTATRNNYEVKVTQAVTSISVEDLSLEVGNQGILNITTEPATDIEELTYTSSDETIAKVDNTGKVTAIGVGDATITVAGTSVSSTCTVTVTINMDDVEVLDYAVITSTGIYNCKLKSSGAYILIKTVQLNASDAVQTEAFDGDEDTYYKQNRGVNYKNSYINVDSSAWGRSLRGLFSSLSSSYACGRIDSVNGEGVSASLTGAIYPSSSLTSVTIPNDCVRLSMLQQSNCIIYELTIQ